MANVLTIDNYDLAESRAIVASFGTDRFGYVVTPNVDHVIRHFHEEQFRQIYSQAAYVLLDSRFLAHIFGIFKFQRLRVSSGSDLTAEVFHRVLKARDAAVLVGGNARQAEELRRQFGLTNLTHVEPPMNFIGDPAAVEACLSAIEAVSPFRFCFLAVGSPRQEILAHLLKERGIARGLALCIGASINFMTGVEKRAPRWIQKLGCEWLYRLLQNPRKMARRYLIRGPRIFTLLPLIELRLRRPVPVPVESHNTGAAAAIAISSRN